MLRRACLSLSSRTFLNEGSMLEGSMLNTSAVSPLVVSALQKTGGGPIANSSFFKQYSRTATPTKELEKDDIDDEMRPATTYDTYSHFSIKGSGGIAMTPSQKREAAGEGSLVLANPVYDYQYLEKIKPRHRVPTRFNEKIGYHAVYLLRTGFDKATGYGPNMTVDKYLQRFIFLESVAAVPGMVGGALRHLRSLRVMKNDNGWIHTMLQEAENERLHLLTFLQLSQPGFVTRALVMMAQGIFYNLYFLSYMLYPKACHSFVGYLEEEAVKTYTHAIEDLRAGRLPEWKGKAAPALAIEYWKLPKRATMEDVLLAVRADERAHEFVNHTLSELRPDDKSPFNMHDMHMP